MRIFLLGALSLVAAATVVVLALFGAHQIGLSGPTCLRDAACKELQRPPIFFSWNDRRMRVSWNRGNLQLSAAEQQLFDATLRKHVEEFLGTDVSTEYDVLPLLSSPVHLTITGSGVLLRGVVTNDTDTFLTRLHEHFAEGLPAGRVATYALSPGISETIIRTDPLSESIANMNGWRVRMTGSGTVLASAMKDGIFVISTSKDLLDKAMRTDPAPLTTYSGILDQAAVENILRRYGIARSLFVRAGWEARAIEWSLAQNGHVMTFDVTSSTLPHRVLP